MKLHRLYETAGTASESVGDIMLDAESRGVRLEVGERGGDLILYMMDTTPVGRGQGLGTEFMQRLTALADRQAKRILLDPDDSVGASSRARLVRFYKCFGFVENKGRNRDFEISQDMIRPPVRKNF